MRKEIVDIKMIVFEQMINFCLNRSKIDVGFKLKLVALLGILSSLTIGLSSLADHWNCRGAHEPIWYTPDSMVCTTSHGVVYFAKQGAFLVDPTFPHIKFLERK